MKTKLLMGAMFFSGLAAGALPTRVFGDASNAAKLEFQTARLFVTRARLPDGGTSSDVAFQACGYLTVGERRVQQPCWNGILSPEATGLAVTEMLAGYDGGM